MNRSSFIRNTTLSAGALFFLNNKSIAAFFTDPFTIKMLTKDIGIFIEKGGTILFYLSKKGAVIIDAQFPDSALHLIDELKKKTSLPFRLLINTHHHGDHTSGNIAFKNLVPHVLAHANSKKNQEEVAIKQKTSDKQLYPDQVFTDKWCEKIGKEKICLHYFGAGHTNGDSVVHLEHSNIVHTGDLVFNRRHPFIDRAAGANISNWMMVLEKTAAMLNNHTKYVCGHASKNYDVLITKEDVLAFRDYLGNLLKFTQEQIAAGKTKEEILKATTIPGSPEWTGDGIERPLTAAFEELTTVKN